MTKLLGILNLSPDSFSDGGQFSAPDAAIAHAHRLVEHGAWGVDIGAVSSNPDGLSLPPAEELARLRAVIESLGGLRLSVDTFHPDVQRALAPDVDMLNDIRGFPDPSVWPVLADADCQLVVMHSIQDGRADRRFTDPKTIVDRVLRFFDERLAALTGAGVHEGRLIVDPGMGFFLGDQPEPSVEVLKAIPRLAAHTGRPVLISVSRKSFLGALLGGRAPLERHTATVVAELMAVNAGAAWIRTHDVRALHDGLTVQQALFAP
jgi:dihydropteroate synthase type 2